MFVLIYVSRMMFVIMDLCLFASTILVQQVFVVDIVYE